MRFFTRSDPAPAAPAAPAASAGYDALGADEVLAHLRDLKPVALAKLADHERAHQNRAAVVAGIDALLGNEPWAGYDALDVTGVRAGLEAAGPDRLLTVLAYERAHRNRPEVVLATQQSVHPGSGADALA